MAEHPEISATLSFRCRRTGEPPGGRSPPGTGAGRNCSPRQRGICRSAEMPEDMHVRDLAGHQLHGALARRSTAGISRRLGWCWAWPWRRATGPSSCIVMRCAHAALEAAFLQAHARGALCASTTTHERRHLSLVRICRWALERGELFLHFQPKTRLGDRRISGVEAAALAASGVRPGVAGGVHPHRRAWTVHPLDSRAGCCTTHWSSCWTTSC